MMHRTGAPTLARVPDTDAYSRMLDALEGTGARVRPRGDSQAYACCPAHEDHTASLSISRSDSGVLLRCHAGCEVDDVLARLQLQRRDLFNAPVQSQARSTVQAEYRYTDEGGRVLYVKERRWPKDFRQYRLMPDGRKEYRLGDVRRVLYRLPDVLSVAADGGTIYVVEGEKDADALAAAGACSTTWTDGAWKAGSSPKWRPEYTQALRGAHVIVVGDNDDPGRNTASDIAARVGPVAATVRVVFPASGKDAFDHLAAGHGIDEFISLTPNLAGTSSEIETAEKAHRGQARIAHRVVLEHGTDLRHVRGIGWFSWSGSCWIEDEDGEPTRRVLATIRQGIHAAADMPGGQDRNELLEDVRKCESSAGVAGVATLTASLHPVALSHRRLDAEPLLFATPGGTIEMATGKLRPNDRLDHITKVAGATPGATGSELWASFLGRVLPDEDVRAFTQRLMGLALLGEVRDHVLPIFTGTGRNGKGVFRDALMAAFGDYAHEADPALLMESKHERHGTFKFQLRGRRLVFCSETEKGRRFAEATVKRLVGGDPIEANRMHKDPIVFQPSHTLVMITNHLPEVSGDDPAIWARIKVVPFDVVIPESEQDPELPRKVRDAAPAVLAWAIEGWREYQRQGLNPPEIVTARTAAYQASSDVLARFFAEMCLTNPNAHVKARELFDAFSGWCRGAGEVAPTEKAFAESMGARGFAKKRTSAGFVYAGVGLYSDDVEPED